MGAKTLMAVMVCGALCAPAGRAQRAEPVRDLTFFLQRLRTLDHLPELEDAHAAMSSTWDRTGGNNDGVDFKRLEGDRNILLDVDGPGCIHRIFTGRLGPKVEGTRIRIFLDQAPAPLFDMEVNDFLRDKEGPLPYPLVFHKTYPGTLFPIPFARHARVELYNPQKKNWGNYWQVTYTIYPPPTRVKSLSWPLNSDEQAELQRVCAAWLAAESKPPPPPAPWTIERQFAIEPGGTAKLDVDGCGVIRELRVAVDPNRPAALRALRLRIAWDDGASPSVDVPLGYFFGNGDFGNSDPKAYFSSLLMGAGEQEAYVRFPMPFERQARLEFVNTGKQRIASLAVRLDVQKLKALPKNWGKFHATWTQEYVSGPDREQLRKFGPREVASHVALERTDGPGKYVGVFLFLHWPYKDWWGEGDWLIWTDENGWPPSYHGTGSEEYFNSGWCLFDRKSVSGVVHDRPGDVGVYTFHLNDAFNFHKNIRVAEEVWTRPERYGLWGSTAYWYALVPQDAHSRKDVLPQRVEIKEGKKQ